LFCSQYFLKTIIVIKMWNISMLLYVSVWYHIIYNYIGAPHCKLL
jgi:hypothetical protein